MLDHYRIRAAVQGTPLLLALLLTLGLGGCATAPPAQQTGTPAEQPAPPLPTQGASVYRIDPDQSELRIRVYRGGPLADLGHNHVVTTSDIQGKIYLHDRLANSGFELTIPVKSFVLDDPQARQQEGEGFEGQLSAQDRQSTKDHMLSKDALDADQYQEIKLRSIAVAGPPWYPRITVRVTLHGTSRDYVVPTAVVRQKDQLIATGGLHIKQTDFGIKPYSAVGGGLVVKDGLDIAFRFVAAPGEK